MRLYLVAIYLVRVYTPFMSRADKLKERFLSKPKDFTWDELSVLLENLGYIECSGGKTGGSRKRFVHKKFAPICLHKPHPRPTLKPYQIKQVQESLKERGQL